nr:hypothetical protein [Candidatus Woesearchaeota archaeon]
METKNIQLESDRRCSVEELERILNDAPISVFGLGLKLVARMELGRIIYIRPIEGKVSYVKVYDVDVENLSNDHLFFNYKNQKFEIQYN